MVLVTVVGGAALAAVSLFSMARARRFRLERNFYADVLQEGVVSYASGVQRGIEIGQVVAQAFEPEEDHKTLLSKAAKAQPRGNDGRFRKPHDIPAGPGREPNQYHVDTAPAVSGKEAGFTRP